MISTSYSQRKFLSNNVYEFLNKRKCNIDGCIYNHDPVAGKKFRKGFLSQRSQLHLVNVVPEGTGLMAACHQSKAKSTIQGKA